MIFLYSYKQAIIIRNDLKMGKGKIAAQASHASISAFLKAKTQDAKEWLPHQKKIVLKVETEKELVELFEQLKQILPCALIRDAGHTQIAPNTLTALGVGPAKEEEIDKFINHLKLL